MKIGLLAAAVCAALVLALPAAAAAPNYILVSGRGLAHPVLLANWRENLKLMLAVANAPRARGPVTRLRARPRFDLAEFWAWGMRPRPTRPADASQHGSFYPSHAAKPALIILQVQGIVVPRLAPPSVLRILGRHGVPTRV